MTSASNAADTAKTVVGLRLIFYSREEELESVILEILEDKEDSWFEGLEDDSPKVKWMRRVYPRIEYTQAPWTVVLRQPSQSIYTLREA